MTELCISNVAAVSRSSGAQPIGGGYLAFGPASDSDLPAIAKQYGTAAGNITRSAGKILMVYLDSGIIVPGDVVELARKLGPFRNAEQDAAGNTTYYFDHCKKYVHVNVGVTAPSNIRVMFGEQLGASVNRTLVVRGKNEVVTIYYFERGRVIASPERESRTAYRFVRNR